MTPPDRAPHPKQVLAARGLRPKKSFGQCFLVDSHHAARIAEVATTPAGGTVVEIGAGLGALTRPLLERASLVVAVERDRDLAPLLRADLARDVEAGRLRVEEADAKTFDVAGALEGVARPRVLAGNLPYALTGPLLERAVQLAPALDRAVFLVQLEVGRRLAARPATREYGALTVFARSAFDVRRAFEVKRGAFYPQPNVDSAVVVLDPRPEPVAEEDDTFRAVVHAAFGERRKKLRNAWRGLLGLPDDAVRAAAERAGISLDARGETLSVEDFARMTREVAR